VCTVALAPTLDERPGNPGRRLGAASATIVDLHGAELVLAGDAAALVDTALRQHLQAQGLTIVAAPAAATWQLEARLQTLQLDVADRDRRSVAVQATLRRISDGKISWTGTAEDRDERFAGVAGNSRADLEGYLGAGIATVAADLAHRVHAATTTTTAAVPMAAAAIPAVPMPVGSPAAAAAAPQLPATGDLLISTTPARVKVYVDAVYQGLSPLTLSLPPGVSELHFVREGYRRASEKVAIRAGRAIELEIKMEALP
jgi:hypothetical protein